MALTGKTIGELTYLQFPTNETLLPVELSGDTYHIAFSSITYNEGTYTQFVAEANNGVLTPGRFYLMTDYQACYDQPNYNNIKNPITTGNYKTGSTEPILLLAISTTGFSPTVYSTLHPQDKISYDITWNITEVTGGPAKGRITERIDNFNNRTDYDNRSILFKRYNGYSYNENNPLSGLVGISGLTGTTAVLYGNTGTTFTSNFSTGDIVSVQNLNPSFFEVLSVVSNSLAIISGVTISVTTDSIYYYGNDDGIMSYYQPNVRQDQVYEYTTFGGVNLDGGAVNNYIGNYSNLYDWDGNPFILANNVFISGEYFNNTIGNDSYNNTFNDDCDNNQIGDSFYNNSTNDDFDGNIIGEGFNNNYITSNFNNNRIGSDFYSNTLLGGSFYRNNIGNGFNNNVWTDYDFQNNEIGNQFNNNKIYNDFYNNDIGNGYNGNQSYSQFYRNLIDNGYNGNTLYSEFYENNIGFNFYNNTIGNNLNIGGTDFRGNNIGSYFESNTIKFNFLSNNILNDFYNNDIYCAFIKNSILNGFNTNTIGGVDNLGLTFENNQIMNNFKGNDIQGNFWSNQLKTDFKANEILGEFGYNNIGFGCSPNIFSGITIHNNIGDNFSFNICYGSFSYNTIGTYFNSNEVQDGFGFGGSNAQGNRIGNNFIDNTIGEYFYNNTISDNFYSNTIGDSFQWNIVNTEVNNVCLSTGMLYDITTVNVFKNKNGDDRLSYYDEVDVLTIETLTEAPCLGGLNALDIPENDLNYGLVIGPSFTITSSDFTFGNNIDTDTTPLGVDGTSGFTNTAPQDSLYDGYYGQGLSGTSLSGLTNAYNNLGLSLNDSTGRLWYVTWGPGSSIPSGIVKFGSNVNGVSFDIQTIDTSDTNYLTPNTGDGTSLVGTFLFPATFTIYYPITDKNGWC